MADEKMDLTFGQDGAAQSTGAAAGTGSDSP